MSGPTGLYLIQQAINDIILTGGHLNGAKVHLYGSAHTPARGDSLATYTAIESAWAGYAAQSPAWTASALTAGDQPGFTQSGTLTFGPNTSGGSVNVYGYYVTDSADTQFLGGETFAGAPIAVPNGVSLAFVVQFQDISEF
jgi:hypothetical protein